MERSWHRNGSPEVAKVQENLRNKRLIVLSVPISSALCKSNRHCFYAGTPGE